MNFVLIANIGTTLFMVGLIWFVQIVHYPLFDHVGSAEYATYQAAHARRTTWVVGPPMLVEAGTALLLVLVPLDAVPVWAARLGLALVGVIWISTALLQVPQHSILGAGFDPAAHRVLVVSNWIRTAAWSGRGVLALWLLARLL